MVTPEQELYGTFWAITLLKLAPKCKRYTKRKRVQNQSLKWWHPPRADLTCSTFNLCKHGRSWWFEHPILSIIRPSEKSVLSIRARLRTLSFGIFHRFTIWLCFARSQGTIHPPKPDKKYEFTGHCLFRLVFSRSMWTLRCVQQKSLVQVFSSGAPWRMISVMNLFSFLLIHEKDFKLTAQYLFDMFYLVSSPFNNLNSEEWNLIPNLEDWSIGFIWEVWSNRSASQDLVILTSIQETEISTAEQYARESIRIARTTRLLDVGCSMDTPYWVIATISSSWLLVS